jgi:hypothetical protein
MHRLHIVSALALVCLLGATAPPSHAALRLNEIMAGPATDWNASGDFSSRDDEWVELANDGAGPVDLSPYLLTDAGATPRYRLSGTLAAGAHLVVYGSDAWTWERDNGHPAFGLSLGNSGDAMILWEIAGSETLMVDNYTYVSHEAAADRASGRFPDASGAWALFDGMNPYTGTTAPQGNGCAPTPGSANVCGSTSAVPSSWGRLKTLYR